MCVCGGGSRHEASSCSVKVVAFPPAGCQHPSTAPLRNLRDCPSASPALHWPRDPLYSIAGRPGLSLLVGTCLPHQTGAPLEREGLS